MYAAASVTIISGAILERTRHVGYISLALLTSSCIYPLIAHWVWAPQGMFSRQNPHALLGGAMDFAGSGVVHLTGGALALCAASHLLVAARAACSCVTRTFSCAA